MEAKKEIAQYDSSTERKELSTQNLIYKQQKYASGMKGKRKMKTFSDERKQREFVTIRLKEWLKETLNRKKRIKEGILEHKDGRKCMMSKNMGNYNRLSFSRIF